MDNHHTLLKKHKEEYTDLLIHNILPYWLDKTDKNNGGFFTCYNVLGDQLISRDKYVWSQGRCVWLYSKLSQNYNINLPNSIRQKCLDLALEGSSFLEKYCILPNGRAAFVLDENNIPKTIKPYGCKAISSFSDCFAAIGFAAAGEIKKSRYYLKLAYRLLVNASQQLQTGTFQTAPDVLPNGWKSQASYMIMIHATTEVAKAMKHFGMVKEIMHLEEICQFSIKTELTYFLTKDSLLLECLDCNFEPLDTLYGRHINPGHIAECSWFLMEAASWLHLTSLEPSALEILKRISCMAWDNEYGGMYYYMDYSGGPPKGSIYKPEQVLSDGALRDWNHKMWWPQLEAIYANLMGYLRHGDLSCWNLYERYRNYTFTTFPNPDLTIGEWIQIRTREGLPLHEAVGGRLPVKDPYHLIRTLMNMIDLISIATV